MRIGVPTEIKNNENRVAMTPAAADTVARGGHEIIVQKGAGLGSGFSDEAYVLPALSSLRQRRRPGLPPTWW